MRKLCRIGGTSFVSRLRGVSVKQLRSWIGLSRILSLTPNKVAAREIWADMANFNMQLHGDLVSVMEECTEGFEIVRNTKTEVGLDAWRRLNHKYIARNPLTNILLAPSQVGWAIQKWLQASKSCEWFSRDLAMICRTSENRYIWCASRRSVRRILRDHSAVHASSLASPEIQRLTIEKSSFKQTCIGQERRPWMSTPLPRPREARKAVR